jgi:hypothetical protein
MVPIVLGVVLGIATRIAMLVVPGIACSVVLVILGSACLVHVLVEVSIMLGVGPSSQVLVVPVVSLLSWVESRHPRPYILMKRGNDKLEGVRERIEGCALSQSLCRGMSSKYIDIGYSLGNRLLN